MPNAPAARRFLGSKTARQRALGAPVLFSEGRAVKDACAFFPRCCVSFLAPRPILLLRSCGLFLRPFEHVERCPAVPVVYCTLFPVHLRSRKRLSFFETSSFERVVRNAGKERLSFLGLLGPVLCACPLSRVCESSFACPLFLFRGPGVRGMVWRCGERSAGEAAVGAVVACFAG